MAQADPTTRFEESVAWIGQMLPHIDFNNEEITYKVDAAGFLTEARDLVIRGDDGWIPAFVAGLRGSNLLSWQTRDNLVRTVGSRPAELAELLRLLWFGAERAAPFNAFVRGLHGLDSIFTTGIGTTVASVMLMGRNARSHPPFGTQAVRAFWKITNWPSTIGDDPWSNYSNFLASLQKFAKVATTAGLPVPDLLTAQGYMWLIVQWDERTVLPATSLAEFRAWRGDPYTGPQDMNSEARNLRLRLLEDLTGCDDLFLTPDELRNMHAGDRPMPLLPRSGDTTSMTEDGSLLGLVLPKSLRAEVLPRKLEADGSIPFPWKTVDRSDQRDKSLLRVLEDQLPIVVLSPASDGSYQVLFPVFVSRCIHKDRSFTLDLTRVYTHLVTDPSDGHADAMLVAPEYERRWNTTTTRSRVHGPAFRRDVLHAYSDRCAVCALNIPRLLDAAHIIPDRDEAGIASVTNGLALCKTHHAAFDANLLGIDENSIIHISSTVLQNQDVTSASEILVRYEGKELVMVPRQGLRPNTASLAERWRQFRAADTSILLPPSARR